MKRFSPWYFVFIGCLLASMALTWPLIARIAQTVPGESISRPDLPEGDLAFFLFSIWWSGHALFDLGVHPWFCSVMGAPEGVSLLYSTIVPLIGCLSYPLLRVLTIPTVYNIWFIVSVALLPFFTIRIVRELGGSWFGAIMAGLLLLYPPILAAHRSHLNILSAYWIPLVFFLYLRAWRTRRTWRFAVFWLGFAAVLYVSAYHTIHAGLLVAFDIALRVWIHRRNPNGLLWKWLAGAFWGGLVIGTLAMTLSIGLGAAILSAVLTTGAVVLFRIAQERRALRKMLMRMTLAAPVGAICVAPFFLVAQLDSRLADADVAMSMMSKAYWSAQPLLYVMPPNMIDSLTARGYLGGGDLLRLDGRREFSVFPGYAWWFLTGLSAWWGWGNRRRKRWLLFSAIFLFLSFGPLVRWGKEVIVGDGKVIALPALLFDYLPLLDGYRVFVRMAFGFHISMAIWLGLTTWRPRPWGRKILVLALVACAVLAFERFDWPMPVREVGVPPFYDKLARAAKNRSRPLNLVEFPNDNGRYLYPLTYHGQRVANKYLSRPESGPGASAQDNWFLHFLQTFDHPRPHLVPEPEGPGGLPAIRRDFDRLGLDGAIAHYDRLGDRAAAIRYVFEGLLELRPVLRDSGIVWYENPRSADRE